MTDKEKGFRRIWAVSLIVIGVLGLIQSADRIVAAINGSGFLPDFLVTVFGVVLPLAAVYLISSGILIAKIEKEKGKDRK